MHSDNNHMSNYFILFTIHSDSSRGSMVYTSVCLSVYPHDIKNICRARITKVNIQLFHDES